MKIRQTVAAVALFAVLGSGVATAQLSEHKDWAEGPVQVLMTEREQREWKQVRSDASAREFIELFWARRDPTPGTQDNEFRTMFESRVEYADAHFGEGRERGALTARGRAFVLLGSPTRLRRNVAQPTPNIESPGEALGPSPQKVIPTETWIYEAPAYNEEALAQCREQLDATRCRVFTMTRSGTPPFLREKELEIAFTDQYGMNNWKLGRSPKTDVTGVLNRARDYFVFQPDLKTVPVYEATVMETTVPGSEIKTSFTSAGLAEAYRRFKTTETSPYQNVYLSYGQYITADGDYFVPVQLYMPANETLKADAEVSFFGVVENQAGDVVAVYEEPVKVAGSKSDVYVQKSLQLEPGEYRGTFGLAVRDQPVTMARAEMSLSGIDKDATSVSQLLLSNNVFALTAPQMPTDPFAFGGIQVVPKGDRVFRNSEELWYFIEVRNPGLDDAGEPKIQVGIDIAGAKRMRAPLSEAQAQQLKGVEGHYAVGSAIPLETFPAGEYTIEIKLIDTVKKQTWTLKESFEVVE